MKFCSFAIFIIAATLSQYADAQCGYAVANGNGQCVPPEVIFGQGDSQQSQPRRETGRWIGAWGAIAEDSEDAKHGEAAGKTSESAAKSDALNLCVQNGGAHCKITFTYHNQCAAVAINEYGQTYRVNAKTENKAERLALHGLTNGSNKKVAYSACSLPVYVQ